VQRICKAMEGLIAAAQRVEHYEISPYGSGRALADAGPEEEVADFPVAFIEGSRNCGPS
jgi:ferritin-like metal-binding protein YciE